MIHFDINASMFQKKRGLSPITLLSGTMESMTYKVAQSLPGFGVPLGVPLTCQLVYLTPFLFLLLLSGCDGAIRVQELECNGEWALNYVCKGKINPTRQLRFLINPQTENIAMIVDNPKSALSANAKIYASCKIINSDNWECDHSRYDKSGEGTVDIIKMLDGEYFSNFGTTFGSSEKYGLSGWRYWAYRTGIVDLAPLGFKGNVTNEEVQRILKDANRSNNF